MIVTLTPNPSIDRTVSVPTLEHGEVNRASGSRIDPGGKGINVARALATNGTEALAVLPSGGPEGHLLQALLRRAGTAYAAVPIEGTTRMNIAVIEPDGTTTKLNEPGPTLSDDELDALLADAHVPAATAILADLGVSSHQLDTGARGFSFQADAPLDMRMDPTRGVPLSAALADLDLATLTKILRELGEEPDAARIARGILAAKPQTTRALADVVRASMSAPRLRQLGLRINPATRTFQALRIYLNHELDELDQLLRDAPERLAVGGRLGIITFHSLEDRRVKQAFARLSRAASPPHGVPILAADLPRARFAIPDDFRHGVTPDEAELAANPRSRSSRLRVLERVLP